MKKYKKDIIIIVILLLTVMGTYFVFFLMNYKEARYVHIYKGDTLIETYPLNKNGAYDIKIDNNFNRIIIKQGTVYMDKADCPDKLCVKQGKISKSGESIICLPHKVVVKISAEERQNDE
ncbi:MAG: NusG domain II-containing protein [Eubacterium sp.]|nr:NusG domain II-containing protein [Eubacterium sp.]